MSTTLTSAVKTLVATAKEIDIPTEEAAARLVEDLTAIRRKAAQLHGQTETTILPLEESTRTDALKVLQEQQSDLLKPTSVPNRSSNILPLLYREVDPCILKLRNDLGLPRLIPYKLNDRSSWFAIALNTQREVEVDFSSAFGDPIVRAQYLDIPLTCLRMLWEGRSARRDWNGSLASRLPIKYTFSGIVPAAARELSQMARFDFGDNILLFAEPSSAPTMEFEFTNTDPDPLIVGISGGKMYLIAEFDTTTLEQVLATTPAGGAALLT